MRDTLGTIDALIQKATHPATPPHEALASALAAVKKIKTEKIRLSLPVDETETSDLLQVARSTAEVIRAHAKSQTEEVRASAANRTVGMIYRFDAPAVVVDTVGMHVRLRLDDGRTSVPLIKNYVIFEDAHAVGLDYRYALTSGAIGLIKGAKEVRA